MKDEVTTRRAEYDREAERRALAAKFYGEHHEAQAAVEADPVLRKRLAEAITAGLRVIDLADVPLYRRPQVVEEAIDAFNAQAIPGGCSICGTTTLRRGWNPRGCMDPQEMPGYVTKSGQRRCAFCDEYLAEHTLDEYLENVFKRIAGVREAYHQVLPANKAKPGDGTPWSHVDAEALRRLVINDKRYIQFVTVAKPSTNVLLGFPAAFVHAEAPIRPKPALRRVLQPKEDARSARLRREREEWEAHIAKRKKDEAEAKAVHLAMLAERDATWTEEDWRRKAERDAWYAANTSRRLLDGRI